MEEIINAVKRAKKTEPRAVQLWELALNAILDSQDRTQTQIRNLLEHKLDELTKQNEA